MLYLQEKFNQCNYLCKKKPSYFLTTEMEIIEMS